MSRGSGGDLLANAVIQRTPEGSTCSVTLLVGGVERDQTDLTSPCEAREVLEVVRAMHSQGASIAAEEVEDGLTPEVQVKVVQRHG